MVFQSLHATVTHDEARLIITARRHAILCIATAACCLVGVAPRRGGGALPESSSYLRGVVTIIIRKMALQTPLLESRRGYVTYLYYSMPLSRSELYYRIVQPFYG